MVIIPAAWMRFVGLAFVAFIFSPSIGWGMESSIFPAGKFQISQYGVVRLTITTSVAMDKGWSYEVAGRTGRIGYWKGDDQRNETGFTAKSTIGDKVCLELHLFQYYDSKGRRWLPIFDSKCEGMQQLALTHQVTGEKLMVQIDVRLAVAPTPLTIDSRMKEMNKVEDLFYFFRTSCLQPSSAVNQNFELLLWSIEMQQGLNSGGEGRFDSGWNQWCWLIGASYQLEYESKYPQAALAKTGHFASQGIIDSLILRTKNMKALGSPNSTRYEELKMQMLLGKYIIEAGHAVRNPGFSPTPEMMNFPSLVDGK